eukprot:TRINITY_DN17290_c0_g1_i1.p1 TRINITY_DN17290_c0_g1~~TRINITY_DN17290_c0_g1_i1.p1  ORF type:complete len:132 (-),score=24.60 TRINITY_DN17290_c0_g1_i1:202-555(-)
MNQKQTSQTWDNFLQTLKQKYEDILGVFQEDIKEFTSTISTDAKSILTDNGQPSIVKLTAGINSLLGPDLNGCDTPRQENRTRHQQINKTEAPEVSLRVALDLPKTDGTEEEWVAWE